MIVIKEIEPIHPSGIVVQSTRCNQKKISAFTNQWNKPNVSVCVHAFIGLDSDGKLKIVQTLPWIDRVWRCGAGRKGSYNNSQSNLKYMRTIWWIVSILHKFISWKQNYVRICVKNIKSLWIISPLIVMRIKRNICF